MLNFQLPEWFSTIMTALGGGTATGIGMKLLEWRQKRREQRLAERKAQADEDATVEEIIDRRIKIILEDDEKTIGRLTEQVAILTKQQMCMAKEAALMRRYIGDLVHALRAANITVPTRPDELKEF